MGKHSRGSCSPGDFDALRSVGVSAGGLSKVCALRSSGGGMGFRTLRAVFMDKSWGLSCSGWAVWAAWAAWAGC